MERGHVHTRAPVYAYVCPLMYVHVCLRGRVSNPTDGDSTVNSTDRDVMKIALGVPHLMLLPNAMLCKCVLWHMLFLIQIS